MKIIGKGIIIRDMSTDDLHQVHELGRLNSKDCDFNPQVLADIFMKEENFSLVLARKNRILGFLISDKSGDSLHLKHLLVNYSIKDRNLKEDLINYFLEKFSHYKINVEINDENTDTLSILKNKGFIRISSAVTLIKENEN